MSQFDAPRLEPNTEQILREARTKEFIQKVNAVAATAQFPPEIEGQLPYREGSAAIYGKRNWQEAIQKYQDGFGTSSVVMDVLSTISGEISFEHVQEVINQLNLLLNRNGIFVLLARPGNSEEILNVAENVRTKNFLPAHAFAAYKDNTTDMIGFVRGQKFEVATKPGNYQGLILVDDTLAQDDPTNTIIKIMHEIGHVDELFNGLTFTAQVRRENKPVKLRTEYTSTRLALKIAFEEYLKTGDKKWIIAAAYQAAIYNRVMG